MTMFSGISGLASGTGLSVSALLAMSDDDMKKMMDRMNAVRSMMDGVGGMKMAMEDVLGAMSRFMGMVGMMNGYAAASAMTASATVTVSPEVAALQAQVATLTAQLNAMRGLHTDTQAPPGNTLVTDTAAAKLDGKLATDLQATLDALKQFMSAAQAANASATVTASAMAAASATASAAPVRKTFQALGHFEDFRGKHDSATSGASTAGYPAELLAAGFAPGVTYTVPEVDSKLKNGGITDTLERMTLKNRLVELGQMP
jgi:hypothetical protein